MKHTFLFSTTSPRTRPRPLSTSDITPVESSEDEDQQLPDPSVGSSRAKLSSQLVMSFSPQYQLYASSDADFDMDMLDSQPSEALLSYSAPWNTVTTPPRSSSSTLVPSSLRNSQYTALGGRIPTPRWGHFRLLDTSFDMVDAPNGIHTSASSHTASIIQSQKLNNAPFQSNHSTTSYETNSDLIRSQLETDHSLFLRRRRLPSPISEDENMISPTAMTEEILHEQDPKGRFRCSSHHHQSTRPRAKDITSPNSSNTILSTSIGIDCERILKHHDQAFRARSSRLEDMDIRNGSQMMIPARP